MAQPTNPKLFGIDEKEYLLKKAETLDWLRRGAPGIDDGMFEILTQFNAVEGVATRWCCVGHEHEGDKRHTFYIMFSLTERGLYWIENWFKAFMKLMLEEMSLTVHRVSLSKTYRLKRDGTMHEVVILKASGLKTVEKHTQFLELVKASFNLVD